MKAKYLLSLTLASGLVLAACGNEEGTASSTGSETAENVIHMGTSPSPSSDLFLEEAAPILEEQGYHIETTDFSNIVVQNNAMAEGEVDINVEQTTLYAESFNAESGADFETITPVPTLAAGLLPGNKTSLEEVEPGDTVGISEDPANLTRALLLLEDIGWIEFESDIPPLEVTVNHITENKVGVELLPIDMYSLPASMPDLDYAVIPGALIYDAEMDADSILAVEELLPEHYLQLVARQEIAEEQWIQDVADVYESDEFRQRIEEISSDANEPNWELADLSDFE